MNGLSQIHSQNEAATIAANTATVANALSQGHSAITYTDELNQTDYTRAPTVFPSRQALTDYVNRHVPLSLQSHLQCHWGSIFTTPAAVPAPTTYQGHAPNASPLQQHSIGDVYPYIILYRAPVSNAWFVQTPSGEVLPTPHTTHAEAEAAIRAIERTA